MVATAAGCADTNPEAQGARPHILLVTADALRADHLSINGYPRNTSPEIDAFASAAWNFSQAVTVIPKTGPSLATLFTGRHPREHGVRSNANAIPPSLSTLAERLRDSGYRTAAFVSNPVLREEKGYTRGFDTYFLLDEKSGPAAVSHAFLRWGRELEGWQQPTFVWLHYIDPHGPYDPPQDLLEPFLEDEWSQSEQQVRFGRGSHYFNPSKLLGAVPSYQRIEEESRAAAYVARYDAEILAVDRAFGLVLRFLRKHDLEDRSAVVFTSDHGESLGEHDYWFEHGWFAYDPSLRIPLLIREPGQSEARSVSTPVSNLDLRPTLLALARVSDDANARGRNLLAAGARDELIVVESSDRYPDKYLGVRSPTWKYLRRESDGAEELYDLENDPGEERNVAAEEPDRLSALRERFERAITDLTPVPDAGLEPFADDPQALERLRDLGYLDE